MERVKGGWGHAIDVIALLLVGDTGLSSIQTAAILTALPFRLVMLLMCIATAKAFHGEHRPVMEAQRKLAATTMADRVSDQVNESMSGQVERQVQERLANNATDVGPCAHSIFGRPLTRRIRSVFTQRLDLIKGVQCSRRHFPRSTYRIE